MQLRWSNLIRVVIRIERLKAGLAVEPRRKFRAKHSITSALLNCQREA